MKNFFRRTLFKIADITNCGTPYIQMEKAAVKDIYEEVISDIPYLIKISPAYIQRRYKVSYDVASEVINLLEDNNLIDLADGAKPRNIIIKLDII
jgi:ribosomal protein S25